MLNEELHLHTEYSRYDSTSHLDDVLSYAKELGVKTLAITEHGVLTGVEKFMAKASEAGIKPVPGVEAYVELGSEGRSHMCLYAKDEIGFKALKHAVTDSFSNVSYGMPIMNAEILTHNFGKGALGHNHVIATSACISGVLSTVLNKNEILHKKINKILLKYDLSDFDALTKKAELLLESKNHIQDKIAELETEIEDLTPTAKKTYGARLKGLLAFDDDTKAILKAEIEAEKKETEKAKETIKILKGKIKGLKVSLKAKSKDYTESMKPLKKLAPHQQELDTLKAEITSEPELYNQTIERARMLNDLFGMGNFYVELQNHRMPEEIRTMPLLAKIATTLNLPIVATNDAHMVRGGDNETRARALIRSLRFIKNSKKTDKFEAPSEYDCELYIKTEEELREILSEILPADTIDEAIKGRHTLLSACDVPMENEKHFPMYPQEIEGESSKDCFMRKIKEGIKERFPDGSFGKAEKDRLNYECSIIKSMGFIDYHLIVADYMQYAKALGEIDFNNLPEDFEENKFDINYLKAHRHDGMGCGIGPGRGSAVGSLVCYLLGITDINPLDYDLLFERFLNPERVSMPDIDCDITSDIREYVFDYIVHKYGADNVCRIATYDKQETKMAIDNAAKLLGSHLYGKTTYFNDKAKALKNLVGIAGEFPSEADTTAFFGNDKDTMQIYHDAKLISGTFLNYGMHAAGAVISDGTPVKDSVALMKDTKTGLLKTQCEKDEVEFTHGLLKMDLLGLSTLGLINECVRAIYKEYGIAIDISQIPFEEEVFAEIYSKGLTNGVFQFESDGMKKLLKRVKPSKIEDIVILNAMYRPGPMENLDDLVRVMTGRDKPTYATPLLKPILSKTYGVIVYQEQVMQIFQSLAGYSLAGADLVRRAMSKKKLSVLEAEKKAFVFGDTNRNIKGCVANGISEKVATDLFERIEAFARYAFNKSHAVAYSVLSYRTAWLKYHYPAIFTASCINNLAFTKRAGIIKEGKALGVKVLPPYVNDAETYALANDNETILGFSNILGFPTALADTIVSERRKNGGYKGIADFIYRTHTSKKSLKALVMGCGLDRFGFLRGSILNASDMFDELSDKVKKEKKKFDDASSAKTKEAKRAVLKQLKNQMENIDMVGPFSVKECDLSDEIEVLGALISSHPLNHIIRPNNIPLIEDLSDKGNVTALGAIRAVNVFKRKRDNEEMATFILEDDTSEIKVCVFPECFSVYRKLIKDGKVVKLNGYIKNDEDEKVLIPESVSLIESSDVMIAIYNTCMDKKEFADLVESLKVFEGGNHPLLLYDSRDGLLKMTPMKVKTEILHSSFDAVALD